MRWLPLLLLLAAPAWGQDMFPHVSVIGINTSTVIDGLVSPLYMAAGTGVDAIESHVEQRLRAPGLLVNMDCVASADPGAGKTIVLTARTGTCGSMADSGTFTCTLTGGAGRPNCNTGTTSLTVVTAGDCWDLKLTMASALTTPVTVECTLERAL